MGLSWFQDIHNVRPTTRGIASGVRGGGGVGRGSWGCDTTPFLSLQSLCPGKDLLPVGKSITTVANLQTELIWLVIQYDLANNRHTGTSRTIIEGQIFIYLCSQTVKTIDFKRS